MTRMSSYRKSSLVDVFHCDLVITQSVVYFLHSCVFVLQSIGGVFLQRHIMSSSTRCHFCVGTFLSAAANHLAHLQS